MSYIPNLACLVILVLLSGTTPSYADDSEDLFNALQELADQGNPSAMYNLGMLYNNGIGTKQDPEKAFDWFMKATEAGDPLGAFKVGCYYDGQFSGVVPINNEKALEYKLIAAEAGYVQAQRSVAQKYISMGNMEETFRWMKAMAAQGDAEAIFFLSSMYHKGDGTQTNYAQAYKYLKIFQERYVKISSPDLLEILDDNARKADPEALATAEAEASSWKPAPTELTIEAQGGIDIAKKLVAQNKAN